MERIRQTAVVAVNVFGAHVESMTQGGPQISVVMSVKDDEAEVWNSVESVLQQNDVDHEFIIINDGSQDGTARVLRQFEKSDSRITVIDQDHRGLTNALIRGCARAKGRYIARQDGGGDISLPGRLRAQYQQLEREDSAVLVFSGARFVGPDGEHLYDSVISQQEFERGMNSLRSDEIKGPPHHGNTMFRRSAYYAIGGYRAAFRVAQDLDLWLRMHEAGAIVVNETIQYVAKIRPGDICFTQRLQQTATTRLVLEAAQLRRSGQSESTLLEEANRLWRDALDEGTINNSLCNRRDAEGFYHIAACLDARDKQRARHYYRLALSKRPLYLRALLRWVTSYLS